MREARVAGGAGALAELAEAWGVVPSYVALSGDRREAGPEATLAVLRALGVSLERPEDAADALWELRQERALRLLEPVTVAWDDAPFVRPRILRSEAGGRIECRLETETGDVHEWVAEGEEVALPAGLGAGYHALTVTVGGRRTATTKLLLAPRAAHDPERRAWGVFLPLYALRTRRSWGTGDFGDLDRLTAWAADLGAGAVGTLPLYASFLARPFDPSPYAPVSRLFWNELYADVERAPELERSAEARALLDNPDLATRIREIRRARLVDYREAYRLKRQVLDALARSFFAGEEWRSDDFLRWLGENPEAQGYAAFRAAAELWPRPWREWPPRMREGRLREGDYGEEAARQHLYAQYLCARQLGAAAETARARGVDLYLDLPLGVHPDGFDAWRFREIFVDGVSAGAPPDDFFAGGQDWGFRPLHPERIRADGYRYVIAAVRHAFRQSGLVRFDHVMGLHRLYWIPFGMPATEGVYVRYPEEELWAILTIESQRWRTAIVGEDLGTVPPEVREAMERHRARRMYVLPFELKEEEARLEAVPACAVASLGTHDMAPFARWWETAGEPRRQALVRALEAAGIAAESPAGTPPRERARRTLAAALEWLAASPARLVLVGIEDLWLEEEPQNEPGTSGEELANWRRKARYPLEMFAEFPDVLEILRAVAARRGGA